MRSVGLIAAVSQNNVLGQYGTIPWHYPLDLKRFSQVTQGSTVIMGRSTWESLPKRAGVEPLIGRKKLVLTSGEIEGYPMVKVFRGLKEALDDSSGDVWLIGGRKVYVEALENSCVDLIDLTIVPRIIDVITPDARRNTVFFNIFEHLRDKFAVNQSLHIDSRLRVLKLQRTP